MKASEVIRILSEYIHTYGDLQVTVEDQEFFNHSPYLQFEVTGKTKYDISSHDAGGELDSMFIAIRS